MIYQTDNIDLVYVGDIHIVSGYVGESLIFPTSEPPTPPTPTVNEYLNFTARNGSATIGLSLNNRTPNISYSFDKETWTTWDYSDITIPQDSTIYFKGNNKYGLNSVDENVKYTMSGTVEGDGNIMSLLFNDDFEDKFEIPSMSCFKYLFHNCTSLITPPQLPATTMKNECYRALFGGCTNLTVAPELPATTLADWCYQNMFAGCTSLTTAPQLPATNLIQYCYREMFNGCTSLTTAPQLPATTLAYQCYAYMFKGCTSLTTAPVLPATTLVGGCYQEMFKDCSKLNYIKAMFTTTPGTNYTSEWVYGVSKNGTFVKNSAATWYIRGISEVPVSWDIEYASE